MELSSPIKLLSLLKLRAEQLKKGKSREQRLKDEPERFPKGFFHRNLPFYKGLSNGTRGLICQLPRRGIKSPGDKTGWKTLNNLNRKETGKPFKQTRGWGGEPCLLSLHCTFLGQGWSWRWELGTSPGASLQARLRGPSGVTILAKGWAGRHAALSGRITGAGEASSIQGGRKTAVWPEQSRPAGRRAWHISALCPEWRPWAEVEVCRQQAGGFLQRSACHSPCTWAKLNLGESAPRRSWLWCRHPQPPEPRPPQHLPAKFSSFSSQLHLHFLQEAPPNLPRTGKCAVFCAPTHTIFLQATLILPQCKTPLPIPTPLREGAPGNSISLFAVLSPGYSPISDTQ